jgi:hypothetical protein
MKGSPSRLEAALPVAEVKPSLMEGLSFPAPARTPDPVVTQFEMGRTLPLLWAKGK